MIQNLIFHLKQRRPSPKSNEALLPPIFQSIKGVNFLPLLISSQAESLGMGWGQERGTEADDVRHKIIDTT